MKKIYLPLVAIATLLAFSVTVVAQRPKLIFNQSASSRWATAANWTVSTGPARTPATGDSIVIPTGLSAYIAGSDASHTLSNVIIVVQAGGTLTIGNGSGGGSNAGALVLDNTSVVSLSSSGSTRGQVVSNTTTNSNNSITIGGVVKFRGGLIYSVNPGSGTGVVTGPAKADASTGVNETGFSFGSLPVVLVGFNANLVSDNKVSIQWTTQQEVSTDQFEIQRSSDGLGWETIARVKASGYSSIQKSYSFVDPTPQTGTNLYRLRMIDFDAHFGFSSVVNVRLNLLGKVSVFPNPSVNNVTISLGHVPASSWTVSLVNHTGQVMIRKTYGKDITTVNLPVNTFPTGNYSIDITDGVSKQTSKLMIAH